MQSQLKQCPLHTKEPTIATELRKVSPVNGSNLDAKLARTPYLHSSLGGINEQIF